jgi:hypothetical protein
MALCRACEVEIPNGTDLGIVLACDDANLSAEFQSLALSVGNSQEVELDNGPPSKRQKVGEDSPLLSRIAKDVYALLGGIQIAE